MKLKETAFSYNVFTESSTDGSSRANPDFSQEIGQARILYPDYDDFGDFSRGLLYTAVKDISNISAPLGKGGNRQALNAMTKYSCEQASIVGIDPSHPTIKKVEVCVNGHVLQDQKFILFIVEDVDPSSHFYGRLILKFSRDAQYTDNNGVIHSYNKDCIDAITNYLGCSPNGSWIVTDMEFIDFDRSHNWQPKLNFSALVINPNSPTTFSSPTERHTWIQTNKPNSTFLGSAVSSNFNKSLDPTILYGPPGTGKTHKLQTEYIDNFAKEDCFVTTFHQSFCYEEFVEGLKPVLEGSDLSYEMVNGIFKKACERAAIKAGYLSLKDCIDDSKDNRESKFKDAINNKKLVLLCIDEINRGNVASIFGDLISLIESSKRLGAKYEMTAILPHSQEEFGVPSNLVIVGTMNTMDKSISVLDSALQRRFKLKELLPNYKVFDAEQSDSQVIKELKEKSKKILTSINNRVKALLSKDCLIGHSYLMNVTSSEAILEAITDNIIPLLEEYFHGDIQKIRFVLNETQKSNDYYFYKEDKDAKKAFNKFSEINDFDDEEKDFYTLVDNIDLNNADKYLDHLFNEVINDEE